MPRPVSLRFASLSSGSRGNALLVEAGDTLLMVDCGLPLKTVRARMRALDRDPGDLAAVVVVGVQLAHQELLVKEILAVMELQMMVQQLVVLVEVVVLVRQVLMHQL